MNERQPVYFYYNMCFSVCIWYVSQSLFLDSMRVFLNNKIDKAMCMSEKRRVTN